MIQSGDRIAIVGSRDFSDLRKVTAFVDTLPEGCVVISGGARGVDRTAVYAAEARGLKTEVYNALWVDGKGNFDKAAGFSRNTLLVEKADKVVAFHDGVSRGTKDTIRKASDAGKLYCVYRED